MEKVRDVLAIIFFLIWIPLGLFLVGGAIVIIVMNPLTMVQDMFSNSFKAMGGPGIGEMDRFDFRGGDPYDPGAGIPSKETIEQMMQEGGSPPGFEDYITPTR